MALKTGLAELQQQGKIRNSSVQDTLTQLAGRLISARVTSINQSGGNLNGNIQCVLMDNIKLNGSEILSSVSPLLPNIKNYPLVNEVVLVLPLPSKNYQSDYNTFDWYYLNPINLWNNPQVNAIPSPKQTTTPSTQNRSYLEVETVGTPNQPSAGGNTELQVGTYFNENPHTNPLYPFEGDFILDGRFGNNIRLGNTVPPGAQNNSYPKNNWSTTGSVGNPITIITNGLHTETPSWNSITEDINTDLSSAYFTSTQKIPIEVASTNGYLSYTEQTEPPTIPNQYTGEQVILNSGRLLFNTTKDHLLLSSQKSINLNAVDSINLDTTGPIVLESSAVYLGSSLADESAILGDTLINALQSLLKNMKGAINIASAQLGNNGVPLEPQGSAFRSLVSSIDFTINDLNSAKSNIVKVE